MTTYGADARLLGADDLPLRGYRVVDFGWVWAGTVAGQIMADMGAEVIKIESRRRLDGLRIGRVFEVGETLELNHHFHNFNRNKKSVTLNISHPRAQELIKRLVSKSDLVVENFTPGTLAQYGLDYEALRLVKPDLVMASITAAGQYGPLHDILAYAPIMQSISGFDSLVGYPDGETLGGKQAYLDVMVALFGCYAALAALHHRDRTGVGQYVDVSGWEAGVALVAEPLLDFQMNRRVAGPQGSESALMAPHGTYPCRGDDVWIAIAVQGESEWQALRDVMGRPAWSADSVFADQARRRLAKSRLDPLIAAWTAEQDVDELAARLQERGVRAFRCLDTGGLFLDPHFSGRQTFQEVDHPVAGRGFVYSTPWRFDDSIAPVRRHAPLLGEHNDEILGGLLGLTPEELAQLVEDKAVY